MFMIFRNFHIMVITRNKCYIYYFFLKFVNLKTINCKCLLLIDRIPIFTSIFNRGNFHDENNILDAYWHSHWNGTSRSCWKKDAKVLSFRTQCYLS